jgi:hypothetical protein
VYVLVSSAHAGEKREQGTLRSLALRRDVRAL